MVLSQISYLGSFRVRNLKTVFLCLSSKVAFWTPNFGGEDNMGQVPKKFGQKIDCTVQLFDSSLLVQRCLTWRALRIQSKFELIGLNKWRQTETFTRSNSSSVKSSKFAHNTSRWRTLTPLNLAGFKLIDFEHLWS